MFTRRLLKIKIHSRRVLIFKRSLPIFAFLLASIMFIWPTLSEQKDKFTAAVMPTGKIKGSSVDMERVRFFSKDDKKRPMTVTAVSVLETDPAKQIITLDKPIATYKMENGVTLTSVTTYGLAFQKEEYLYFEEEVETTTDTGWKCLSSKVICDYKEGTLESDSPIFISGPDGKLTAKSGFFLFEKGDKINFKGETETVITSQGTPIRITSENGMNINQTDKTITAHKNVVVKQKNQTITADKIVAYYVEHAKKGDSKISKIVAEGHVTASNQSQKITGDSGVYNPRSGLMEMTGNVVLHHGKNQAKGTKATLNLKTGKSSLTARENSGAPARVKGTLIPADLK